MVFIRIILELQVSRTLGPIITTISYMFQDIAKFLVLWVLILMGFTTGALVIFWEIAELNTITAGTVFFANAAFGNYDLTVFDILI